ncbi:MAG TPA: CBS domain-containing protein [Propionibacteriaceae bacterium]|nr:CBS domain-containing protein [Propionibacteriaceae bacterium]
MYISRLRGLPIIDVDGDSIGKLHDVVIQVRGQGRPPRVKGLVAELFARRRAYLPMERVYSIDAVQIVVSGVVNTRRFHRREGETLVLEDLQGRRVVRRGTSNPTTIFDVAMHAGRGDDWEVTKVALRDIPKALQFSSRVPVSIVPWQDVPDLSTSALEGDEALLAEMADMKPADVARELHDMAPERRVEVAHALDDRQLADAIEELPEDEQVDLITLLDPERAADVLEEMDPDDAADLISELPDDVAETLLERMRPEDAQDVRDLLVYEDDSAGGMMTPEPVIVAPDSTVADALALARVEEVPPALAGMVFVCRPPLEAPTGRFIGGVHLQRLLREPPSTLVSALIDHELRPLLPSAELATVSRYFATYDVLVVPVVDAEHHLLGAVTVDDVLDHMLPEDWRGLQMEGVLTPDEDRRG